MPKKKRTRKQKIHADVRHHHEELPMNQGQGHTYSVEGLALTPIAKSSDTQRHQIATHEYGYLSADLFKTTILTAAIILIELSVHFLAKTN